jgi:uncharacterized protein (DUF488 family)
MAATKHSSAKPRVVYSIGHSNRSYEDFLEVLRTHGIERVVDVRTVPRSRHNPQFNRENLASELPKAGISYVHLKELGGLRHPRRDSVNLGWKNAGFRGFADYMDTPEFEEGLKKLLELASTARSAVMCAEAVPWRCHRSVLADALAVRSVPVEHILSTARTQPHSLTKFARVENHRVTYPAMEGELFADTIEEAAKKARRTKA